MILLFRRLGWSKYNRLLIWWYAFSLWNPWRLRLLYLTLILLSSNPQVYLIPSKYFLFWIPWRRNAHVLGICHCRSHARWKSPKNMYLELDPANNIPHRGSIGIYHHIYCIITLWYFQQTLQKSWILLPQRNQPSQVAEIFSVLVVRYCTTDYNPNNYIFPNILEETWIPPMWLFETIFWRRFGEGSFHRWG